MSIWLYTKDKNNKRSLTSISIPYPLVILLLGLVFGIVAPPLISGRYPPGFLANSFIVGAGFFLLFIAKLFQFKAGIWTTWGWGNMPRIGKAYYLSGYILMVYGVIKLSGFL